MLDDLPESALLLDVRMQAGSLLLLSAVLSFVLGFGFLLDRFGVLRLSKSSFGLDMGLLISRLLFELLPPNRTLFWTYISCAEIAE